MAVPVPLPPLPSAGDPRGRRVAGVAPARLRADRLALAWLASAAVVAVVSFDVRRESFRRFARLEDVPADARPRIVAALDRLRLTPEDLAWAQLVTFDLAGVALSLAVGWLLIRRGPRTAFTALLAFWFLCGNNATYPPAIDDFLPGQPLAQLVTRATTLVTVAGLFTLPFVFPDGRFVPRWTALWGAHNLLAVGTFAFAPDRIPSGGRWLWVEVASTGLLVLSAAYAVVHRYRRVASPAQRRQTRWVVLGLLVGLPGFFLGDALMRNISADPVGVACLLGFTLVMPVAFLAVPATVGVALLNDRLFDVDVVLGRTLTWLAMTAAVVAAYAGLVLGVGALLGSDGDGGNLLLSLLATGLVAVAFQPARARVQRAVDRLLFGERDDPYAVLARVASRVEDALAPADLLPAIVRTAQEALRLPYAALLLERPGGPVLAAAAGAPPGAGATLRLPMVYQGQTVGALEVAPRGPGEPFSAADRRLLEDLARQVGVAARTVALADDLQRSRERIVLAREEERRRLRRDLHDGLGAQLAALILQAGALRALYRADPDAADREVAALRAELRAAVADVRRLVAGLRPPALDELGLAGALAERVARLDAAASDPDPGDLPGPRLRLTAPDALPPLPAAVEVAAFRIAEEALTNALRHARARTVLLTLVVDTDAPDGPALRLTVADDGLGLAATVPADASGLGLHSMRERARELGGACTVGPNPAGPGTLVVLTLPLAAPRPTAAAPTAAAPTAAAPTAAASGPRTPDP